MTDVALTIIGDDRAGLVSVLTGVVAKNDGNWLDSQMARLAGKFAGIALVQIPESRMDAFERDLAELRVDGLSITAHRTAEVPAPGEHLVMHLVGNDHPGIMAQITSSLAALRISIDELITGTMAAPMSGGVLFQAEALLRVPAGVSAQSVRAALEPLARELMVDLEVKAED